MPVPDALPPGPRLPAAAQTLEWVARPVPLLERARRRHGKLFTLRLGPSDVVVTSDPEVVREVLLGPPDVMHMGDVNGLFRPILGSQSLLLLDGDVHLRRRKLMLPPFHGAALGAYTAVVEDVCERAIATWPTDGPFALLPRMQQVTVEVVLRAVFGLAEGERLDHLRPLVVELLERCRSLSTMVPQLRRSLGGRSPWAGLMRSVAAVDEALFAEIRRRRAHPTGGADVLSLLLAARDESGAGLGDRELRDELLTLLVAGHETTATALAFTFERLVRAPQVHERLVAEVDAGAGERYLTATVREALRVRPVLPIVARKLTRDHEVAGRTYARGTVLMPCAWLLHREPDLYPDPERFAPERFLRARPDTYAWLPFGGGVRRCIGASFAELEMRIVVRSVLERLRVAAPAGQGDEAVVRRSFTFAPEHGGLVVAERRRGAQPRPAHVVRRELATAA